MILSRVFGSSKDGKFGTIAGVFIPNVLQMIGVILFMRCGWILGHVGMFTMGFVIVLCSTLILLTSLSMTAIVSNMKMRGGGAYYLISRSLGVEFGSAIGVLQCISQLCSISLCVTGFSLSINELFPDFPVFATKAITLVTLILISYYSTALAMKTQFLIFVTLFTGIAAIFFGYSGIPENLPLLPSTVKMTFWMAFSMFFPATTGIESGMSMSGDLRTPSRSLPIGTIASVLSVFVLYFGMTFFLSLKAPLEYLRAYPFLIYHTNHYGFLVLLGVWAATLSSALGAILGGPRVMQAIAKDGVLPKFLAKGYGSTNQPRTATLVVLVLSMILTLFTDINQIIPIMTMACLVGYGLINFIAFIEAFMKNPSWRPTFRMPSYISLIASLGCFFAMFMINPGATFIVSFLVAGLCFWTSSRKINANWDDIRYSIFSYFVHKGTIKLSTLEKSAKNWRPQILALFNSSMIHKNMAYFAHALNRERGFLTFGVNLQEPQPTLAAEMKRHLKEFRIPSHVLINNFSQPVVAAGQMIRNYGFGRLKPNTVLFSIPTQFNDQEFIQLILDTHSQKKNVILLKDDPNTDYIYSSTAKRNKKIDLWWRGKYPGNFEFSLALAFMLQQSNFCPFSTITIKMIAKNEEAKANLVLQFEKYRSRLRIQNLEFAPIVASESEENDFFSILSKSSTEADLTFLGLKKPTEKTNTEDYREYYSKLLEKTQAINNVVYVLSGELIRFRKIFL